jgi:cytochrome c oxidase cbb3-type subunit I
MHFLFSVYGIITVALVALFGGLCRGRARRTGNNHGSVRMPKRAYPYAVAITFAWCLILFSNIFFFLHLALMWLRLGRRSSHPTLLVRSHGSPPARTARRATSTTPAPDTPTAH